jgi:hypothetical protein
MSYIVNVGCCKETSHYFVNSSDIPGLKVETGAFEKFAEGVLDAVPGLLGNTAFGSQIDFHQRIVRAA